MRIEIKLFASLSAYAAHKDLAPDGSLCLESPATIRDAVLHLGVPESEIKLVFLNGVRGSMDALLNENDRVGIFPPIGGG